MMRDDQRAYGLRCPVCWAVPVAKCTAPTATSRRTVAWIHDLRVLELDKTPRNTEKKDSGWQ